MEKYSKKTSLRKQNFFSTKFYPSYLPSINLHQISELQLHTRKILGIVYKFYFF